MSVPFAVKFGYRSVPQHGLRALNAPGVIPPREGMPAHKKGPGFRRGLYVGDEVAGT
jgi:hypothetical protein